MILYSKSKIFGIFLYWTVVYGLKTISNSFKEDLPFHFWPLRLSVECCWIESSTSSNRQLSLTQAMVQSRRRFLQMNGDLMSTRNGHGLGWWWLFLYLKIYIDNYWDGEKPFIYILYGRTLSVNTNAYNGTFFWEITNNISKYMLNEKYNKVHKN